MEPSSPTSRTGLRRGDVRVLTGHGRRQIVVVLAVVPTHVIFALAHPYDEYATADDIVFDRDVVTRYRLVLCTGLVGTALAERFDDDVLGTVPDEALGTGKLVDIRRVAAGPRWSCGPELRGPFDARSDFLAAMRGVVADLSAESLEEILGDDT